jgi:hypothetical protein
MRTTLAAVRGTRGEPVTGVEDYTAELVWISTRQHLARFEAIRKESPPWYRSGGLAVPEDFPQVRMASLLWTSIVPAVMVSRGSLSLSDATISYRATPDNASSHGTYRNLDTEMVFTSAIDAVALLGRFQSASSGSSYYAANWIEMSVPSLPGPILMCVGGSGPSMRRIREQTDRLFQEIQRRRRS